jgi:hypothetical protein
MQIVWHPEAAKKLSSVHTVLELETFPVNGEMFTAWCVVPAEKIGLNGLASLPALKDLHAQLIEAWKVRNYKLCQEIIPHLMEKFGGELDTFYETLLEKIKNELVLFNNSNQ